MAGVIVVYAVINFIVQSVIQPRIVGDRVGLSSTITFLSLVFWTGHRAARSHPGCPAQPAGPGMLVEADPLGRWLLPLVSGRAPEAARETAGTEPISAR